MPDHMNYYGSTTLTTGKAMKRYFADKANIFKYQKWGYTYAEYEEDLRNKKIPKPIVKIWTGR
jgi:UDP-N-acetylmuramoylalanine-D-glutamate ligase